MAKIEIAPEDRGILADLFAQNKRQTVIFDAALDHLFGKTYADSAADPEIAMLQLGVFTQIAGDLNHPALKDLLADASHTVIIPETDAWYDAISAIVGTGKRVPDRWGFSFEALDIEHVRDLSQQISLEYEIKPIHGDKEIAKKGGGGTAYASEEEHWDHCIGFGVVQNDSIVSVALSYINSKQGIDVSVSTNKDHRRKGLATAVSATLIAYCLDHNIEPHWNAANAESLGLAQKLGYVQNDFYHPIPLFP